MKRRSKEEGEEEEEEEEEKKERKEEEEEEKEDVLSEIWAKRKRGFSPKVCCPDDPEPRWSPTFSHL